MSKRLELVWPDKDKVLRGLDENGKPMLGAPQLGNLCRPI